MRYKDRTLRELEVIKNGVNTLKIAVEQNTITAPQLLSQFDQLVRLVESIEEKISTETDDLGIRDKF